MDWNGGMTGLDGRVLPIQKLQPCYMVVTWLLQPCNRVVTRLLQGCFTSRIAHHENRVVARLLQGCYKVVTRLLTSSQPCYKVVAWLNF